MVESPLCRERLSTATFPCSEIRINVDSLSGKPVAQKISHRDFCSGVGRLKTALKDTGELEATAILIGGDHGNVFAITESELTG